MDSISLLKKLVSVNSVFPNESELAHFLSEELRRHGFNVEMQEFEKKRFNVLASRGTVGKPILLYSHIDTVPAYGYNEIGKNPFELEEREGKLYGLGVYDMKAGMAAILKTVEEVNDDRAIKILFAADEEFDSKGCYAVTKTDFLKDVEFAISTEMSDVSDSNERTRMITIGRRGRVQYEISIPGKSFHAAKMEQGISAISEAAKLALELEKMNNELPRHPKMSHGNQYVRKFLSESVSLSLPDSATMLVDRHLIVPETAESARQQIEDKINQLYAKGLMHDANGKRATVIIRPREVPYMMPYILKESNPHVTRLGSIIKERFGAEATYNCGLSVADENMIAMQGVPIITYGPIGGGEHSNNEWVSKKSYLELIEVLKAFLSS